MAHCPGQGGIGPTCYPNKKIKNTSITIKKKGRSSPSLTATTTTFGMCKHRRCDHAHLGAPISPAMLQLRTWNPIHERTDLRVGDVKVPTSRLSTRQLSLLVLSFLVEVNIVVFFSLVGWMAANPIAGGGTTRAYPRERGWPVVPLLNAAPSGPIPLSVRSPPWIAPPPFSISADGSYHGAVQWWIWRT
jgi:hypothetical protein